MVNINGKEVELVATQPIEEELELVGARSVGPYQTAQDLIAQADRAVVSSEQTETAATDLVKALGEGWKTVDGKRKSLVDPLNLARTRINESFKPLLDSLKAAKQIANSKLTAYQVEQERIKREAERKKREAEEAERLELAEKLEKADLTEQAETITQQAVKKSATVKRTEVKVKSAAGATGATSSVRTTITFDDVLDIRKIPDRFLEVRRGELIASANVEKKKLIERLREGGRTIAAAELEAENQIIAVLKKKCPGVEWRLHKQSAVR